MRNAESKVLRLCKKLKIDTPIVTLTKIMGGTDPRRVSQVYLKIKELEDEYGGEPPDEFDWFDLVELIKSEYRGSIVEISKSQDAAKQLMEYMHPKRKSVEMVTTDKPIKEKPLTKKEIRLLRKEFNLDY